MTDNSNAIPERMEAIRPLLMSARIPAVTARTPAGEVFDVNAAVRKQRTVLLFYRGGW